MNDTAATAPVAPLEVTTLGRFEMRFAAPGGGVRREYAPASLELFKYLVSRRDLRGSHREIKAALWPADDLDGIAAARVRDGNFASARARLEEWFEAAGIAGVVISDGETLALEPERCSVDAVAADVALGRIVRGELGGAEALAALAAYDRPFLPADLAERRDGRRDRPWITARRADLAQRTFFATAAALRRAALDGNDERIVAELAERARRARDDANRERSRSAAEALAEALGLVDARRSGTGTSRSAADAARERLRPVGRDAELRDIRARLGAARSGTILAIEGRSGVGATFLARAAARALAESGERTLVDLTATPAADAPEGIAATAVLAAAESLGPALAGPALMAVAPDLVRAIPALRAWFPDLAASSDDALPSGARRAALFAHAVRLLDAVRPALALVDRRDLEDPHAREFATELVYLIGRYRASMRLAVVLTGRPGDGRRRAFPSEGIERFELAPLSHAAALELAKRIAPRGIAPQALVERADGLPANLVYLAANGGRVDASYAALRLRDASANARDLLAVFARADAPSTFDAAVADAGGTPGDDAWFDALEELLDDGWLVEGDRGYTVRERLVAESLREASAAP